MGRSSIRELVCYGANRKKVVVYKAPSQMVLLSCEPRALSIDNGHLKQSVLVSLPPTHSQPHPHISIAVFMTSHFHHNGVKLDRDGQSTK